MPVTPPQPPISTIPPITILPALPPSAQIAVLSALFEPSDALQEIALPLLLSGGFGSYVAWIDVIGKQLRSLAESASSNDIRALDEILRAHPRLGEKKIQSIRSGAEQASLHGSPDDEGRLRELNQRYEQVFPGLRYMIFVNGRSRDVILHDMLLRIERGDIQLERQYAIQAMCDIAADRAHHSSVG